MGSKINQDQNQEVQFHSIPVSKVRCHYFTSPEIDELQEIKRSVSRMNPRKITIPKDIEREQQIDIVTFEGKVTKVICNHLEGENCSSTKNNGKPCHLNK